MISRSNGSTRGSYESFIKAYRLNQMIIELEKPGLLRSQTDDEEDEEDNEDEEDVELEEADLEMSDETDSYE